MRAVLDLAPASEEFRQQIVAGLRHSPRTLPSKFFYDEIGSAIFNRICELPEYYVTRTEMRILRDHGAAMAKGLGARAELIGLGTGAGTKTRILIEHLESPTAYLPVDISKEQLTQSAAAFHRDFPELEIIPVCADYLQPFALPTPKHHAARKTVYFPGSTIGNLEPAQARAFLEKIVGMAGAGGGLLIGVDLKKARDILERAYNDAAGVTADFNLNLLARANRELGANFDLAHWRHRAVYHSSAGRIEMHLISTQAQTVQLGDDDFSFAAGEHIISEFSYKYAPHEFIALADQAGLRFEKLWTDAEQLFGVFLFAVKQQT
ncbi:MAG: L-histidine N(alpha)-methyltransferase [Verrucomicrobiota bacterium]|nr:L-histidine N(alpha)-methyltransferase [Verrucomicrobiota bacterium]